MGNDLGHGTTKEVQQKILLITILFTLMSMICWSVKYKNGKRL